MIGKRKYIRSIKRRDPTRNTRELASCYGKVRYAKTDRERALENRPSRVTFYKCDFCKNYHLGRKKGSKFNAKSNDVR